MTTVTPHRRPAGTPVGGQFAPTGKAAPDVSVQLADRELVAIPTALVDGDVARAEARFTRALAEVDRAHQVAVAREVRAAHPDVAAMELEWDDEELVVRSLYDADGNDLQDADDEEDYYSARDTINRVLEDHAGYLNDWRKAAYRQWQPPAETRQVNIEQTLKRALHRPIDEISTDTARPGPLERADTVMRDYALAFDTDFQPEEAVAGLLTDLRHHCTNRGISFDDALQASARWVSTERRLNGLG